MSRLVPVILGMLCLFVSTRSFAEDWPKYRRDLANTGRSAEQGISSSNVASLLLKWRFASDGRITGSPAVATVNGVSTVLFGTWRGSFYAVNAVTGAQVWKYSIPLSSPTPNCFTLSIGCEIPGSAAVAQGVVYFGSRSGYVYALNAATGTEVWKTQIADPSKGYEIWSSPAVYNGLVYIGLASHDDTPCVAGSVRALNATTGVPVWTFSTVDQTSCPSGVCVGASVWSSPAVDTVNNIVYVSTGNPGSTCKPATANATRYPDSVLAISATSGSLLNYFQAIANDTQDKDFGSSPVLHTVGLVNQCNGTARVKNLVSDGSKNSVVYTIPRGPGGISGSAYQIPLDGSPIIASPALIPHKSVTSCSTSDLSRTVLTNDLIFPTVRGNLFDLTENRNGPSTTGWDVPFSAGLYSAPATIRDIIFLGGTDHNVYALTTTGIVIWHYTTGGAIDSGPAISNGRIYIGSNDTGMYAFSLNGQ